MGRSILIVTMWIGLFTAFATAATAPATQPMATTKPLAAPSPTTRPDRLTARPTTLVSTTKPTTFPTPAELLTKMKAIKQEQDKLLKIAYFDLSGPIVEKPADFSLFGDPDVTTLRVLLDRLKQAREDKDIRGVLVTLGESEFSLAQAQEVRDALAEISRAGKQTFVYADSYDTAGYTLASGATNICILEGGEIMMPGIGIEATFAKGLLDKIGVKADYVQIGEFKGADEQYTRTEPTNELCGELNKLMDSMYEQIIDGISLHRNLTKDAVRQMVDDAMIGARPAKDRGLVDHLVDQDGLRKLMADELGGEVNLLHDYGKTEHEAVDFSNPFSLLASLAKKPETTNRPAIALIYATGVIVDGDGGQGMFGGAGVGSETIRKAMRSAARDENVKALVIRIDSPGGSALASEVMWQAARHVAEVKPVVVSVGSMAASGGYYLASSADTIYADPSAIVGSIGVVGGKFVMKDLFDKLGLTTESFRRGRNADLFSSSQPFNDRQRRMVTNWMKQTYDQFTQRVMTTRSGKIKDIDQVARGRIFVARQAKELGMVDEIGGIHDAIADAAKKADLEDGEYDVKVLPNPLGTLADLFSGGGAEAASPIRPAIQIGDDSLLRVLSPSIRKVLGQQIQMLQLLEDRPVILATPFTITVK